MSPQKYGSRANMLAPRDREPCVVCDEVPRFSWTDAHGEAYCLTCGTPYRLLRDGQQLPAPECQIMPESLPVLRRYWSEEHRGNGLGSFFVWSDYPDQHEDREVFTAWCDAHPELAPS